jgi:mannose-6-phosphate isomerase-like protein (cupin superfamily)
MVRKGAEMRSETRAEMGGGKGSVDVIQIMERDEFRGKGRLFARNILKPGTSIGYHKHVGDFEVYFIARGEGIFNDNGTLVPVSAGDVGIIKNGQSHAIENTGKEEMEVIALVLFD